MPQERVIKTFIPELDGALGGGISRGRGLGILGSLGTGKTTLSLQIAYNNISNGNTCSFHTHDQSAEMLVEKMKSFGCDPEPYMENLHILDFYTNLAPSEDELDTLPSMTLEDDLAKKLDFRLLLQRSSKEMRQALGGKLPDILILDSATPLFIQLGGRKLYVLFRMAKQLFLRNTVSIVTAQSDIIPEIDINTLLSLSDYSVSIVKKELGTFTLNIEKSMNVITKPQFSFRISASGISDLSDEIVATPEISPNKFSSAIDVNRSQLVGRQVLFEFDPLTRYDLCIKDFCEEAIANDEEAVVITRRASPVYRILQKKEQIHLLSSSEKTMISPILREYSVGDYALVLDGITEKIILEGFEPTFNYVRNAIELLSEKNFTTLFLINPDAHSPREISTIRGLFSNHITCDKDGLRKNRLG